MRYDDIIVLLGDFGPYQQRLYYTMCLVAIFFAFNMLVPVFILAIPDFRCAVSDNDTYGSQDPDILRLLNCSTPWTIEGNSSIRQPQTCQVYNTTGLECKGKPANTMLEECTEFVYDTSIYKSTVITELNLVCGGEYLRSVANMMMMGGTLVGSVILGVLADIIGRRKVVLLAILLLIGSGVGTAFAPNYAAFVIFRFFAGFATAGLFLTAFVIGMELVGPSKRVWTGIFIEFYWCAGLFILAGLAYAIRDWRHLELAISLPAILLVALYWLVPESPRWLIARGRMEEAESILRKVASTNHVTLPDMLLDPATLADEGPKGSVWDLVSSPLLFVRSLIIFFNWFAISVVFYGLGLNVGNLSGDVYLNFTIASAAETLSYILSIFLLDRVGRKILHCGSMLLGGIACLATIFPVLYGNESLQWVTTLLSMIGKLGVSAAYGIIYVYTAELFPTAVRNSAVGIASCMAGAGSMVSPYIADLGTLVHTDLHQALSLIVFGAMAVVAGGLALYLPETRNRKLPETVDDAIHYGKKSVYIIDVDSKKPEETKEKYNKILDITKL